MTRSLGLQRRLVGIVLFAAACAASSAARAVVVVNNLGETITGGASVFGTDPILASASPFTTGPGLWQINTVTVKMEEALGSSADGFVLEIRNDNGGSPGATVLGTFNMSANDVTTLADYTYAPVAPIVLAGGTDYWLAAFPQAADAEHYWQVTSSPNDNGVLGWSIGNFNLYSPDNGAVWVANGNEPTMFSIDATDVIPEPTSLLLGMLAVGTLGFARRRSC